MTLPNADRAIVEDAKVRDYLLSPEHPVGRGKARVFAALGFTRDRWPLLRDALLALAHGDEAEIGEATVFGQKYVVRGMIRGPGGRTGAVVTAWIVRRGEDAPRLVSAYPGEAL